MHKSVSLLFGFACLATALQSNSILGAGVWFWVILLSGFFVAASAHLPKIASLGAALAAILVIIAIGAILLGLVAATAGGSFRLQPSEALLLFFFGLICIFGVMVIYTNKRRIMHNNQFKA